MKKIYLLLIPLIICIISVSGCVSDSDYSGSLTNESRNVTDFNKINYNGGGDLIINQGNNTSLIVESDGNMTSNINTSVKNGVLYIDDSSTNSEHIKYYITLQNLNSINSNGVGVIRCNKLKADYLDIDINGGSKYNFTDLDVNTLNINMNGDSTVILSGIANNQIININGNGNYQANNLSSKTATITINYGIVTVRVSDLINIDIKEAGTLNYIGNPQINKQIAGKGTVNQIKG